MPDFTFYVSDKLPSLDFYLYRLPNSHIALISAKGTPLDLTVLSASVSAYVRLLGASSNAIVGSCTPVSAASGHVRLHVSAAATGSASAFTAPGDYVGQLAISQPAGVETSVEFSIAVRNSYRVN